MTFAAALCGFAAFAFAAFAFAALRGFADLRAGFGAAGLVILRYFAWYSCTCAPPEAELREVVARAPAEVPTSFRVSGMLHVRFWDLPAFSHYVDWAEALGTAEAMKWVPNIYTRAHYLLAFILVERGQLDEAYAQLERARKLEPNHPRVLGEMGHIRHGQKRLAEALAQFEAVPGVGPFVTAENYADASVVCRPNAATESFQDEPVVIIEVISPDTRRADEGEKKDHYALINSLLVYLLVEQHAVAVQVFRRTDDGFVREAYEGSDAVIPLPEIGAQLALADVYERVEFQEGSEI